MPDPVRRRGKCPHRPAAKTKMIGQPVIVVEDRPGPTDHRVGMNVRPIIKIEIGDEPLAERVNRLEIVDAKSVGRAHRGDNRGNPLAGRKRVAGGTFKGIKAHRVIEVALDGDDVVLPDAEPCRDVQGRIVSLLRDKYDSVIADAAPACSRRRFFESDPHSVE
jgi:hypothetical protein